MKRFELTSQQIQILNMQLIESGLNNTICCSWNMGEDVCVDALTTAIKRLINMHQAFNIRVVREEETFYQFFDSSMPVSFECIEVKARRT